MQVSNAVFAYLRSTHEFVVVRSFHAGKLEVFTDDRRLFVSPSELIFA